MRDFSVFLLTITRLRFDLLLIKNGVIFGNSGFILNAGDFQPPRTTMPPNTPSRVVISFLTRGGGHAKICGTYADLVGT